MATRKSKGLVYVLDVEKPVVKALSRLLRSEGYESAGYVSAREFMAKHDANASGCVVMDVAMPDVSGLELQQWLARTRSTLPVIFITGQGDVRTSVRAMKAGAVDFLTKPVPEEELLNAVREAVKRGREARAARAQIAAVQERLARLTPRESEVMRYVISGRLNKQIAAALGTVEKTIKVHRARVMQKMEVDSVADLVRMTEKAGVKRMPAQAT